MKYGPCSLGGVCLIAGIFQAKAEEINYPTRPVRIVTGFAAGGNTDIIARAVARKLSDLLGQSVIVENKPGAGSMMGSDYVAKATADGYTLLLVSGAFTTQAAVIKKLPFDPLHDFAWISNAVSYPFAIVVNPSLPWQNVSDLIAFAKKNPTKINYGSVGVGSVLHLAAELFNVTANVEMTHIPYKGGAEHVFELMSGRIDVVFETLTSAFPYIQSGKLRVLAVTSLERSPQLPQVPTVTQTLPGYEVSSFSGFCAPRETPKPVIQRLNQQLKSILQMEDIRKRFTELGGTVDYTTPEAFALRIESETAKWKRIAKAKKIEIL
jgi:tripartite-type tricarboxylate transporter receptor subunit TctC